MKQRMLGFNLVEVLDVVVIIGILAGVGYPAYVDYVRENRRYMAVNKLNDILLEMQEALLMQDDYSRGGTLSDEYYTYAIYINSADNYEIYAYPKTGTDQEFDECIQIKLTHEYSEPICIGRNWSPLVTKW